MIDRLAAFRFASVALFAASFAVGCDDPAGPEVGAASGVIAFTSNRGDSVHRYYVMPAAGGPARALPLTLELSLIQPLAWSPDGSRLVFAGRDGAGVWALYTVRADGTGLTALLQNDFVRNPAWSPDGKTIAFIDDVSLDGRTGRRLGIVNADGTGPRYLTEDEGFVEWPSWSPDGRSIVFQRSVGAGASNLFIMDVATGRTTQLTDGSQLDQRPAWGRGP